MIYKEIKMKRPLYYDKSDNSKEFIRKLENNLKPIIEEFINKGYSAEQISHSISLYCFDVELNKYLEL